MIVPPTLVIDQQMQQLLSAWNIKFLHLDSVPPEQLASFLEKEKPSILLSSIERLTEREVQAALLTIRIVYMAIDEFHVSLYSI